jgi:3-oxoacyl-[acyl-carrier protein] reductase
MRLQDRVALITGAGRGIGRAIALSYAKEGARLALSARTLPELEETARQAEALGAETCIIPTDVTDQTQVDEMVKETLDRCSTIDIMVNNAGIGGPVGPLQDNDVKEWTRTIEVNVIGAYLCCRAVLPVMLSRNRGKIINMSGVGGRNCSSYGASKTALVYITEVLAEELDGKNIQVNAMSPGSIHTRMWEETRDGAAAVGDEELFQYGQRVTSGGGASMDRAADLAVFLASDDSGNLSGRLVQAVSDDFPSLPPRVPDIMASDIYKLRRVELS